jgi:hypothetical protein
MQQSKHATVYKHAHPKGTRTSSRPAASRAPRRTPSPTAVPPALALLECPEYPTTLPGTLGRVGVHAHRCRRARAVGGLVQRKPGQVPMQIGAVREDAIGSPTAAPRRSRRSPLPSCHPSAPYSVSKPRSPAPSRSPAPPTHASAKWLGLHSALLISSLCSASSIRPRSLQTSRTQRSHPLCHTRMQAPQAIALGRVGAAAAALP